MNSSPTTTNPPTSDEKPLILLGAGGHAKVLIEALRRSGARIKAVATPEIPKGGEYLGVPVMGGDDDVLLLSPGDISLVNGLGSTGALGRRKHLFEKFKAKGFSFARVIHPSSVIAGDAELGEGVQIMAGSVIQPGTTIGPNTIINTRASVDHDCTIGAHVHIAPGVTLSGGVRIDDSVHVGTGADVIQGISISKNSLVGAGALVIRPVDEQQMVFGVPARLARTLREWRRVLIPGNYSIRQALQVIDTEAMRVAVIVDTHDTLIGILTDGDIRRGLLAGVLLDDPVSRVMNTNPITVSESDSHESILKLMARRMIHQVPVVDQQRRVIRVELLENYLLNRLS